MRTFWFTVCVRVTTTTNHAPLARRASMSCAHVETLTCDVVVNVLPASPPIISLSYTWSNERTSERTRVSQSVGRFFILPKSRHRDSSPPRTRSVKKHHIPLERYSHPSSPWLPLSPVAHPLRVASLRRANASPRVSPCSFYCYSLRFSAATTTTTTRVSRSQPSVVSPHRLSVSLSISH